MSRLHVSALALLSLTSVIRPAAAASQQHLPPPAAEPEAVVDSLWSAFDRTYALFEDKRVPWTAVGKAYRARARTVASDEQLFELMAEMLSLLNDNHVKLTGWGGIMSAGGSLRGVFDITDFSAEVIRTYLASDPQERAGGLVSYAWLPDSIGYIHVTALGDLESSMAAMEEALSTFASAPGVVLDLRRNFGGDDSVARALASLFADQPRHYKTTWLKRGPGPGDFTAPRYWHVAPPPGGGFTRPVVALTHGFTFSAGENLVLALRVLPHITFLGSETSGSLGETYNDVVLDGWVYRTVIQRIVDADGRSWEGPGIPPDLRVVNTRADLEAGRDRVLEVAMDLIFSAGERLARRASVPEAASRPIRLPLADSLAAWIDVDGLPRAMERFRRARTDTVRWFLAEDWEYGDLTSLGRRLLDDGRFDAAVAVLEAAAEAYSGSYRPFVWLDRAYRETHRDAEAQSARRRALELNPRLYADDRRIAIELEGRIPVSYRFFDTLFDEGADSAIEAYRTAMSEAPDRVDVDPLILVRGGQQLREAAKYEEARKVFSFVVEEFPGWPIGHLGLAETLRAMGDVEAATRAYRTVIELDPDHGLAQKRLADAEQAEG